MEKSTVRKRQRVTYTSELPSMTQQHLKNECDVNSILEKYRKTGMITHTRGPGSYGDFTGYGDFKENLELLRAAQDAFDGLPAHLRKRFGNDPSNLIEFISDNSNYQEAVSLGLVEKKPENQQSAKNDDKTTKTADQQPQATTTPPQA